MNVRTLLITAISLTLVASNGLAAAAQSPAPAIATPSAAAPAAATPPTQTAATGPSVPTTGEDSLFAQSAELVNDAQIIEARYVLGKSKDPTARRFAQKVSDEYSAAERKLLKAAAVSDVPVEQGVISPDDRMPPDELRGLSDPQLAATYLRDQVANGRQVVLTLEGEQSAGTDPALKAYAASQEAIVKADIDAANRLIGGVQ